MEAPSVGLLQALAHPLRLRILKLIGRRRVCQCELAGLLGEHPVNISRHLSVLERSGVIRFDGREIQGLPTHELVEMGVVLISEERHLFPEMSVMENLRLGAYAKNARAKEAENLEVVFGMFPKLKAFAKKPALTLSGGEARMLAIGRGLMSNARFLAIDEPSFGLAPILVEQMFEMIKEINKQGTTILLVEQNVRACIDIAHRAYVIENGRIVGRGSGEELLSFESVRSAYLGDCNV